MSLTDKDNDLIEAAKNTIRSRYRKDWHVVGAALRTRSGLLFTGVHLEANVGRIAVCAEAIALGRAATEAGETEVETIVAVYHSGEQGADPGIEVVAPCGMCRELIFDYSPNARVLVPSQNGQAIAVQVSDLVPHKYKRPET